MRFGWSLLGAYVPIRGRCLTSHLPYPHTTHKPTRTKRQGLELGNLEANWQRPLQPGDNQGNAFRLRVRGVRPATVAAGDVEGHDASSSSWRAELEGRLGQVKAGGFLNYFGPQRLSAAHRGAGPEGLPAAWEVGRALLRKDWEGVTRLLLGPREGDDAVGGWVCG